MGLEALYEAKLKGDGKLNKEDWKALSRQEKVLVVLILIVPTSIVVLCDLIYFSQG